MRTLKKMVSRKIRDVLYHKAHAKKVSTILATIGYPDKREIKRINDYANDVLGWQGYAPWLYVYSSVQGGFKEGWIPDNYYGSVVVPRINGAWGALSAKKTLATRIFRHSSLASDPFPDIGSVVNGMFFSREGAVFKNIRDIESFIFRASSKIVFKLDASSQGRGVLFTEKGDGNLPSFLKLGNGVFQEYINQHSSFNEIVSSSVATLRLTTASDVMGVISLRGGILRLSRQGESHVTSHSSIRIPFDMRTGKLGERGFMSDWSSIDRHPDTGFLFHEMSIPAFQACVETVMNLHQQIPFVRCIGWDVIVDKAEQVKVMEWNAGHNDIKFLEAFQGPCFADLEWADLWRDTEADAFPEATG